MAKQWQLTQATFDNLLDWLDSDREQAGKKYEDIRQSLIKIFVWRGCSEAEDLADITINRVAQKLPELAETYVGDPALYFYGVARNVIFEHRKRKVNQAPLPTLAQWNDIELKEAAVDLELQHECMERCLRELNDHDRDLVMRYYQREKQAKIDSRKELSRQLGISPLTLRVKMHRLRMVLYKCIEKCLVLARLETS
jgi:RNA polymerase sigma factor (sigma-70 family)